MVIDAYSVKLGGYRSYAHGMISIGAVRFDGESFMDEFHYLMKPEDNLGYQPGFLRMAMTSLEDMNKNGLHPLEAISKFLLWVNDSSGAWTMNQKSVDFIDVQLRKIPACRMAPSESNENVTDCIPSHFLNELMRNGYKFKRSADVCEFYNVLRAMGIVDERITSTESLMKFVGIDPGHYYSSDALTQAKQTAMTFFRLHEKLENHFQNDKSIGKTL